MKKTSLLLLTSYFSLLTLALGAKSGEAYGYDPLQGATYRGNLLRDGHYLNEPAPDLQKVSWQFKTGGMVIASPVVTGGKVFVGSHDGSFYCLDAEKGTKLWAFEAGAPIYSSATIYDGVVFFTANNAKLYALDAASGTKKWEAELTTEKKLNHLSSPGVAFGIVFIGSGTEQKLGVCGWSGKRLIGFDVATGEKVWQDNAPKGIGLECIGASVIFPNGTLLSNSSWYCSVLIDLATGSYLWNGSRTDTLTAGHYYATHCSGGGDIAYVATARGGDQSGQSQTSQLIAISLKDGAKQKNKWTVYPYPDFGEGGLKQKPKDGKDHTCWAPLAIAEGILLAPNNDGFLRAFEAEKGGRLWETDLKAPLRSGPSLAGGCVVIAGNDGKIHTLDLKTGKLKNSVPVGTKFQSSPAISGGKVYIGSDDGCVYAIE